jgi:hypothetical protein
MQTNTYRGVVPSGCGHAHPTGRGIYADFLRAWLFLAFGEFADFATAMCHWVVTFATLGYGDKPLPQDVKFYGSPSMNPQMRPAQRSKGSVRQADKDS